MKKDSGSRKLPVTAALLGIAALVLRRMLYAAALDEKNLLVRNHPLEIALAALTAGVLLYLALAVRKLDGSNRYEDNYRADVPAAIGHLAAGAGILTTVLTGVPAMYGYLGTVWRLLGLVSPVCMLLAGFFRMQGKKPFFLLHMIPCLFFALHIVNHYQLWSGNPQLQDYIFTLLGTMALMFFGFYTAAFEAGCGNRRMVLGMGLAAVYLCLAELARSAYPVLYLGGILWVLTGMCSAEPVLADEKD